MSTDLLESPTGSTGLPGPESEQQRRCTRCHRWLPIQQFRFANRSQGKRHAQCTKCGTELEGARRIGHRSRRIYEDFLAASRRKYTATALAALCQEMIERYGGISKFARRWFEAVEAAKQSGRTATSLRSFMVLARIMAAHEALSPKLYELSDEELAARAEQSLVQLIMEQPVLAVRVCRQLGWQVIPAERGPVAEFEVPSDPHVEYREPQSR